MTSTVDDIANGMRVLFEPGGIHEQRSPSAGMFGLYTDIDAAARDAFQLSQDPAVKAVYWSLNPVQDDLLNRSPNRLSRAGAGTCAKDADVVRRRWILIDFDPVRPADTNSTDDEKQTAHALCDAASQWLAEQGWPAGIKADSGNGSHLLYRIDLPANDCGLVKRCLDALADRFTTEFVDVDRKVGNASRICKVYGTLSRKGPHTEERPHRCSSIISIPATIEIVTKEMIEAVIPQVPQRGNLEKHALGFAPSEPRNNDRQQILARAEKWLAKRPGGVSGQGGHLDTFTAVQSVVRGFDLTESEALSILEPWNQSACSPPWSDSELRHKVQSARETGTMEVGKLLNAPFERNGHDAQRLADAVEGVEGPPPYRVEVISHEQFCKSDYRQRFLVKRILVDGQPCILGGPHKCLKTSIALDLAFSLGTGTKFLGQFEVPEPVPVAVLSGESGGFTLQRTMREVARGRNMLMATPAPIYWGFKLPQVSKPDHLAALGDMIVENSIRVCMVDPAYLFLLSGSQGRQASNIFDMGSILQGLTEMGQATACTIVILHHFKKSANPMERFGAPSLEDLSMSGFAEWARQWILLNRRERYEPGAGIHRLWMGVGGSAGHGGAWSLDVDEGVMDDDFGGRQWAVSVDLASQAIEQQQQRKADAKNDKATRDFDERCQKIVAELEAHPEGLTKRQMRSVMKNPDHITTSVNALLEDGRITEFELRDTKNRKQQGFRIAVEEIVNPWGFTTTETD